MQARARTWQCEVCGYVHEGNEPPEVCPVCGVGREFFKETPLADEAPLVTSSAPGRRIVVVGGGIAGISAVDRARDVDPQAELVLVHQEPLPFYSRLNLTRFLAGELDETGLLLREADWAARRGITLVHGTATAIERAEKRVMLRDGRALSYDALVLATGAEASRPKIPWAARDGVWVLRTREDAQQVLTRALSTKGPCVCIGGGLLGLETAFALRRRGCNATVLEGAPRLMPRQLAVATAHRLRQHLESLGLTIVCDAKVAGIDGDGEAGAVRAVRLEDGTAINASVVVIAAGIRPTCTLAEQAKLEVGRAVTVDSHLATSDAAIFAAGDGAEFASTVYGLWTAAEAQGAVAGANAAGAAQEFAALSFPTRLKVVDVELFSMGQFMGDSDGEQVFEREDAARGSYVRVVTRDGRVVGANLLGDLSQARALTEAIEQHAPFAALK